MSSPFTFWALGAAIHLILGLPQSPLAATASTSTEPDTGVPAEAHTPFILPFRAADVVFDSKASFAWLADTNGLRIVRLDLRTGLADRQFPLNQWPLRLGLSADGDRMLAALSPSARLLRTGYVAEFNLPTATRIREVPIDTGINDLLVGPGDLLIGAIGRGDMMVYRLGEARRLDAKAPSVLRLARSASPTNFYQFGLTGLSRWSLAPATGRLTLEGFVQNTGLAGDDLFLLPGGTQVLSGGGRVLTSNPSLPFDQDLQLVQTVHTGRVDAVAFDLTTRALFLLGTGTRSPPYRTNLYHYHLDSRLLLGTQAVTNGSRFLAANPEFVFAVAIRTNGTVFQRFPNPAAGSESNRPPIARFTVGPGEATTLRAVTVDASASEDPDEGDAGLLFRWDWEGDGTFETDFEANATQVHRFNLEGSYSVVLEVRDQLGATARVTHEIAVRAEEDPGHEPATANTPFVLPFAPSALVFDPVRPRLFAVHMAGKELVRMNLTSGLVDRVYSFDHFPDSLAISADGKHLGLTTLHRPNYTLPTSPWLAFLAHVDLERDVKTREYGLATVPRSLALSSRGYAVLGGQGTVTPASGVHVYRILTGELLHRGPPYDSTRSTVHPNQSVFYAVTINSSTHVAYPFEVREDGSVSRGVAFSSEFLSDRLEMLDADRLVSGVGGVFLSSSDPAQDGRFLANLNQAVDDLAPDPGHRAFFVAGRTWAGQSFVRLHHLSTFEIGQEFSVPEGTRHVHATDDFLFWVSVNGETATVNRIPNPAVGGETNQPPIARFDVSPQEPVAGQPIRFDAGSSSDDGGSAQLRYRWDWNGDGAYDTSASGDAVVSHTFEHGGTRTVVLQVVDRHGETNVIEHTLHVTVAPGDGTTVFEVGFAAAAVQFHPDGARVYFFDAAGRRVVAVTLDSGRIVREALMAYSATSMAMTPDFQNLVVALRRRISPDAEGEGTLVILDPETLSVRNAFDVAMDPEDVLATDAGIVVAASGSGQWTSVRTFRMNTGEELGAAQVFYHGRLALHPSQRVFYVSTTALNPPSFTRFDLDPSSGFITPGATSGAAAGDVFPAPNGTELVSASGALLRASGNADQDLQVLRQIVDATFHDVHFDVTNSLVFGIGTFWIDGSMPRLVVLANDYSVMSEEPMPAATRFVHAAAPYLDTVEVESQRTIVRRRMHPTAVLRLAARLRPENGGGTEIEIETTGAPGREFILWRSADLRIWAPIETNRMEQGSRLVRPGSSSVAEFYRATLRE